MKKDIILQISNKNIQQIDYSRKGLIKKEYILNKSIISSMDDIKINIRNRNLSLLIENEEIHVKHLTVPKVEKYDLNSIVKNQLKYLYGKKSEETFYTYLICNENNKEIELLVFCANCERLNKLSSCNIRYKINKVTLIQLCFLNYFQSSIVDKDYIFLFKYNSNIYILAVVDKKIVGNKILEENQISSISNDIEYMWHKAFNYEGRISKIYCVNFDDNTTINCISNIEKWKIIDLGNIDESKILEYFIINRR